MHTLNLYLIITMNCTLGGLNAGGGTNVDKNSDVVSTQPKKQSEKSPSSQRLSTNHSEEHSEEKNKEKAEFDTAVSEIALQIQSLQDQYETTAVHDALTMLNYLSAEMVLKQTKVEVSLTDDKLLETNIENFKIAMDVLTNKLKIDHKHFLLVLTLIDSLFKTLDKKLEEGKSIYITPTESQTALENLIKQIFVVCKEEYSSSYDCSGLATRILSKFPSIIRNHYPPDQGWENMKIKSDEFRRLYNRAFVEL